MTEKTQKNPAVSWRIITPKEPVLWAQSTEESWYLLPPNRYVATSTQQAEIEDQLSGWSELKSGSLYRRLDGTKNLFGKSILVERDRSRGIGDLLFVTGPLKWLDHVNSYSPKIYYYAALNRSSVLTGINFLAHQAPMSGAVCYDTFPRYAAHWHIEVATEYDDQDDQENVYDCLFRQINVDPETVSEQYKRPTVQLVPADLVRRDNFYKLIYFERDLDLRKKPYWVVAPLTASTLRTASYVMWLEVIKELSKNQPVIIVGQATNGLVPSGDISFTAFYQEISELSKSNQNVINLIGNTPMRLTVGLIEQAQGFIGLDSGPLYIAQGLRTPAISLWGPQHPGTRIGYDQEYMDLAIWEKESCPHAPCFSFDGFPESKCPRGKAQQLCEPLQTLRPSTVLSYVEKIKSKVVTTIAPKFVSGTPSK